MAKKPSKPKTAKAAVAAPDQPAKPAVVKIAAAKGRPMLTWVGKRPLAHVQVFPAQLIERFAPNQPHPPHPPNLLFHGDNKDVLAWLLANGYRGKVQLVYIDPPFDSGADYVRKVGLRGPKGSLKVEGETYTLGEQVQYTDIWANDNYLQFIYERLLLLKELLSASGVIVVHLDEARVHYVKTILDEVFGNEQFVNEVIWKRQSAHSDSGQGAKHLGRLHDSLLIYGMGEDFTWNELFTPYTQGYVDAFYRHVEPETGRRFRLSDATAPGGPGKGNPHYEFLGVTRFWRFKREKMQHLFEQGRIVQTAPGTVPQQKRYLDEMEGVPLQSIWDDLAPIQSQAAERVDYPTQKPEGLLTRIIKLTSRPGDVVLDCFIGSGTTAAVAQKLGRRWIGCDINKGAIQTTLKRLQPIIREQAEAAAPAKAKHLFDDLKDAPVHGPLAIDVYRVNDYDLQIQHNEAVGLACELLGVQRSRSDAYFDGTRGKQLVKITPFNHPLSPLDLEVLQQELKSRPDEDRNILIVCLGMELAAKRTVDEWNVHRKGKSGINRIEVIELRSDPKYGRFIAHAPAQAKVTIARKKDTLVITIDDFVSPTIVERLQQQAGVLQPRIDDWRAMVDSVMIDPAYDGTVFNVALSDVPEKKAGFVIGRYELPAPKGKTVVAVKITDMLGEEVLATREV